MESDLTDKFNEVNSEVKFKVREIMMELARSCGSEIGLSADQVLKNMNRYMKLPLAMQIEYNLTGWKGYEGIIIPREGFHEDSIDLKRKLLAMDMLDGKIDMDTGAAYDAQLLRIKSSYNNLKDIVITEIIFSGNGSYKN